jgi:hypothetical protein
VSAVNPSVSQLLLLRFSFSAAAIGFDSAWTDIRCRISTLFHSSHGLGSFLGKDRIFPFMKTKIFVSPASCQTKPRKSISLRPAAADDSDFSASSISSSSCCKPREIRKKFALDVADHPAAAAPKSRNRVVALKKDSGRRRRKRRRTDSNFYRIDRRGHLELAFPDYLAGKRGRR